MSKICEKHCVEKKTRKYFSFRRQKLRSRTYCIFCNRERGRLYYSKNSTEQKRRKREYNAANPNKVHDADLWKHFRIRRVEYERIFDIQNGVCGICKSDSPKRKEIKNWPVDHDRITKRVRGLLCHPCNLALGYMKDDINLLLAAIQYLTDPPAYCQEDAEETETKV